MKRSLSCCVAVALPLVVGEARADEPPAPPPSCAAAFETAELDLRPTEAHLLEARVALRVCAHPTCNSWMVDDCTKRLVEVESRIPSVVFSAEDGRGGALHDVRVLEGGRELVARLDGRAVEMDPGPHELVAERGGVRAALSTVVFEGRKAQHVLFAFRDAPAAASLERVHPWAQPVAGGMLLGGAVAGGVGFGLLARAIAQKDDANCDPRNVCDDAPLANARDAARGATIAFVASGALLAGSVVTFLLFGRARVQATASFHHVQFAAVW